MIDVKTADRELQLYIRPQTFPVAIRMLRADEAIPEKARRPARDFKKLSMNCQVIDMARRYGWMIALTREDHICSLGIAALGFERRSWWRRSIAPSSSRTWSASTPTPPRSCA